VYEFVIDYRTGTSRFRQTASGTTADHPVSVRRESVRKTMTMPGLQSKAHEDEVAQRRLQWPEGDEACGASSGVREALR